MYEAAHGTPIQAIPLNFNGVFICTKTSVSSLSIALTSSHLSHCFQFTHQKMFIWLVHKDIRVTFALLMKNAC